MNKRKLAARLSLYALFIIGLLLVLHSLGFTIADIHPDTIRRITHDNLLLLLIIMLFIMILQNFFTFIPLILVITTNITLFGFWTGYLYGCLCSVIGSMAMFLSIRYLFHDAFAKKNVSKFQEKLKKNGFLFVLSARILPFLPTNLINIAAAVSPIKWSHFLVATTIGNMIYSFILASLAIGLISTASYNPLYLLAIAAVAVVGFILYKKWNKTKNPDVLS